MMSQSPVDPHTLELLEFGKVRDLLAGYATSSLGKDLALELEPGCDREAIERRQRLVVEMAEALSSSLPPPLTGLRDVRLLVRRAAIGSILSASELLEVKQVLLCTGDVYRYRMRLDVRWKELADLLCRVEDLGLVAKAIEGCIDNRGNVLDMASDELGRVRQELRRLDERAHAELRRLLRDPDIRRALRYPNATVSGDHYVLPVAVNYRHMVPGVVHRTSATGETVFVEPASLASLGAERVLRKAEEHKEVTRILRQLTARIADVAKRLLTAIDVLAQVDLIQAMARMSIDYRMTAPMFDDQGRLWLRQARHPILEHLYRNRHCSRPGRAADAEEGSEPSSVVPIDVRLGFPYVLLVITGPNTGGKTVALKTVGLLCAMAQAGMPIPAASGSMVPLFRHIFADIGDEQSLEQSLSTFSSHMSRIATILREADSESLVLLDELGAGTDPTEGAALGRAILDELVRKRCRAIVTTHLGDLKTYAFSSSLAENAAVEFDSDTLRPTYRLIIGQYGMSNALKIARRLKLPRALIRRAVRYLRRRHRQTPALAQLQAARQEAEKAREQALQARLESERHRAEYERRLASLQQEARNAEALEQARNRLKPGDSVRVARLERSGEIVRIDWKKRTAVVRSGIGQWEVRLDDVVPAGE